MKSQRRATKRKQNNYAAAILPLVLPAAENLGDSQNYLPGCTTSCTSRASASCSCRIWCASPASPPFSLCHSSSGSSSRRPACTTSWRLQGPTPRRPPPGGGQRFHWGAPPLPARRARRQLRRPGGADPERVSTVGAPDRLPMPRGLRVPTEPSDAERLPVVEPRARACQ
eukprot:3981970-Prymnesium_polylepis.1